MCGRGGKGGEGAMAPSPLPTSFVTLTRQDARSMQKKGEFGGSERGLNVSKGVQTAQKMALQTMPRA